HLVVFSYQSEYYLNNQVVLLGVHSRKVLQSYHNIGELGHLISILPIWNHLFK
ncbi:unnamed protein product, partial [Schistosoma spindalis]